MFTKIEELLLETRKVPHTGKQRCIRLSSELDESLTEIAQTAQSILGYNVSVSHVARMILQLYQQELHDVLLDKQDSIRRRAFPVAATEDYSETDDSVDDEDATLDPEEAADEESEEEYIRRMLDTTALDTSSWEP
jgi:hypothetical protein